MNNKNYVAVFYGKSENDVICDKGDDPCFTGIPTWGICRPNIRKSLQVGDTVFFLAEIKGQYYLKGWIEVGKKIDYISALRDFPNNKNVIIAEKQRGTINTDWKGNKALKKSHRDKYSSNSDFLSRLVVDEIIFYQNKTDGHEINNWKCGRIFNCWTKQLIQCIENNKCEKDNVDITDIRYRNYIVANPDASCDVDYLEITIDDIGMKESVIRTPCGQHNPLILLDGRKEELIDFVNTRKKNGNYKHVAPYEWFRRECKI